MEKDKKRKHVRIEDRWAQDDAPLILTKEEYEAQLKKEKKEKKDSKKKQNNNR